MWSSATASVSASTGKVNRVADLKPSYTQGLQNTTLNELLIKI